MGRTAQLGPAAALAGCIALFGAIACGLGPACDYDLRNYHLYNAHALLAGRLGLDLVPAQLQSFHPPALDTLIETARLLLNRHPAAFLCLLALPYAGAAWLVWRMQTELLRPPPTRRETVPGGIATETTLAESRVARQVFAVCAALAGATGAAALPTLGGPTSAAPVDCLVLLGAWLCWRAPSDRRLRAAGLCLGAALGLKLTAAGACAGVGLAWLLTDATPGRVRRLGWFAAAGIAGAVLTAGWWWWWLWRHTGNPLFPYYNDVFRSPWLPPDGFADRRFLPRSVLQALFYPFWWAFHPSQQASELPVRDPRLAMLEVLVLGLLAACSLSPPLRRRLFDRQAAFLVIVCVVTYAAWAVQFGILRYLAVLEFFGGAVAVIPMRLLGPRGWRVAAFAAPLVLAGLLAVTLYPDWGRAARRDVVAEVRLPPLPPGSLLILLDPAPMAYVALATPPDVALVGANNNLVRPGDDFPLARRIAARIRSHTGPLYGLEMPAEAGNAAATTLRFFGLHRRPGCTRVRSSLDNDGITLCELARDDR